MSCATECHPRVIVHRLAMYAHVQNPSSVEVDTNPNSYHVDCLFLFFFFSCLLRVCFQWRYQQWSHSSPTSGSMNGDVNKRRITLVRVSFRDFGLRQSVRYLASLSGFTRARYQEPLISSVGRKRRLSRVSHQNVAPLLLQPVEHDDTGLKALFFHSASSRRCIVFTCQRLPASLP